MDIAILFIVSAAVFILSLFVGYSFFFRLLNSIFKNFKYTKIDSVLKIVPIDPITKLLTKPLKIEKFSKDARLENEFSLDKVLAYKELSLIGSVILIFYISKDASVSQTVSLLILFTGLSWFWPEMFLKQRAVKIRHLAGKSLTHVIDLLRLYVSAGQNLEGALRHAASGAHGFWKEELNRVVFKLDAGVPFEEAVAMAQSRINLPDFNKFMIALKQSRVLGASLYGTLTVQANILRTRRKQKAEEHARKASVKIAVPLVLCIFPALLIIYLAPAILKLLSGF